MSQTIVRLGNGDIAPAFATHDVFDQQVQIGGQRDQYVLLSFFRNSACALCNLRVHQLIERYPQYQAQGLAVIAVFESSQESIRQYVGKQDAPFPIIPDPDGTLYNLYGVEVSEAKVQATLRHDQTQTIIAQAYEAGFELTEEPGSNFHRIPADFLLAPDGKIHTAFYAERVGEHLTFELIEKVIGI